MLDTFGPTQSTNGHPRGARRIATTARRVAERAIRAGATTYDRERDLPALIRTDPFAAIPNTLDSVTSIVRRLERALRAERKRAGSGHWTYDLNRHIALRQAYLAETERLARFQRER